MEIPKLYDALNTASPLQVTCELDARHLRCPLPLLKAKQALAKLASGDILCVVATDAGSVKDFHTFARLASHTLLSFQEINSEYVYWIKKK